MEPVRILIFVAEPATRSSVMGAAHLRSLALPLAPLERMGLLTLHIHLKTRHDDVAPLIGLHRPDVALFLCHGTTDALLLEAPDGTHTPVDLDRLATYFPPGHDTQLVVLASCWSRALAEGLTGHVPFVIGMHEALDVTHAPLFVRALGQALAGGASIQEAFAAAREDLAGVGTRYTPRLLVRPGASARHVHLAAPSLRPRSLAGPEVRLAASLQAGPAGVAVGAAEAALQRLDDAWRDPTIGVYRVRGDVGRGKTHLLRTWLARMAQRGWSGAARVFTWSFDATRGDGPCVRTFLREALRALAGERDGDGVDPRGDAERLIRALRRTPSLLVLDDLDSLTGDETSPIHDATLVELLARLARPMAGLCIVATRAAIAASDARCELVVPDLPDARAGAVLLWDRGLTWDSSARSALADAYHRHPLALTVLAGTLADRDRDDAETLLATADVGDPLTRAWQLACADLDARERAALRVLAAAVAPMSLVELAALVDLPGSVDALARLRRRGLVRIDPDGQGVALAHRGTVDLARKLAEGDAAVDELRRRAVDRLAERLAALPGGPNEQVDITAALHAIDDAVRLACLAGDVTGAHDIYLKHGCRDPAPDRNHIGRVWGAYGEDLAMTSRFFLPGAPWAELHPQIGAEHRAHVLHRVGIAQRNIGEFAVAADVLGRAFAAHAEHGHLADAILCANDLAEVHLCRGSLAAAEQALAATAGWHDSAAMTRWSFVLAATRGMIAREHGDGAAADAHLAAARDQLRALNPTVVTLASRPGYYYTLRLIDRHEEAGAVVAEIEGVLADHVVDLARRKADPSVAPVSQALAQLAEGMRHAALARRAPVGSDEREAQSQSAETRLTEAITRLRRYQHMWMLPTLYALRARTLRLLRPDEPGAEEDARTALRLAKRLHMPHAEVDARIELAGIRSVRRAEHLGRAAAILTEHPSGRRSRILATL
jgi:hypothetical protein